MRSRIRWGAIASVMFIIMAVIIGTIGDPTVAYVLGYAAIAMAVLSLNETS